MGDAMWTYLASKEEYAVVFGDGSSGYLFYVFGAILALSSLVFFFLWLVPYRRKVSHGLIEFIGSIQFGLMIFLLGPGLFVAADIVLVLLIVSMAFWKKIASALELDTKMTKQWWAYYVIAFAVYLLPATVYALLARAELVVA